MTGQINRNLVRPARSSPARASQDVGACGGPILLWCNSRGRLLLLLFAAAPVAQDEEASRRRRPPRRRRGDRQASRAGDHIQRGRALPDFGRRPGLASAARPAPAGPVGGRRFGARGDELLCESRPSTPAAVVKSTNPKSSYKARPPAGTSSSATRRRTWATRAPTCAARTTCGCAGGSPCMAGGGARDRGRGRAGPGEAAGRGARSGPATEKGGRRRTPTAPA